MYATYRNYAAVDYPYQFIYYKEVYGDQLGVPIDYENEDWTCMTQDYGFCKAVQKAVGKPVPSYELVSYNLT